MTSIVVFRRSDPEPVVHLATDSRAIDERGEASSTVKTVTLPTIAAGLAVMGSTDVLTFLATALMQMSASGTFEEAVRALPEALWRVQGIRSKAGAQGHQVAILAGIGRDGPRIFACATDPASGIEPGISVDVGTFFAVPATAQTYEMFRLPSDTSAINVKADIPRLMEIQREMDTEGHGGLPAKDLIGGAVVLTSIYARRIEQRIIGHLTSP
ncbi:hypothetical protein MWN34_18930 [Ancylobacter sp. 6x-1]|uniref:Uncharacterized protein n=1 Tax=Ancylobacter crimeensis TaxID=2579147 RepID=A0ABT0DGU6_9HYPH|nr:hypothetical protein [Ancylobacter crimeensis]MCK0198977.1 hypothetical protein [Ancylobacter crimeensis]